MLSFSMICLCCVPVQAGTNLQSFQTGKSSLMIVQVADCESEPSYEYQDGYESGYQAGWRDGYKDGCEDGYNAGVEATIEYFGDIYGWDQGQIESAYADNYWRRTIDEEGGNVDSDYVEFYWEELPEYPATAQ